MKTLGSLPTSLPTSLRTGLLPGLLPGLFPGLLIAALLSGCAIPRHAAKPAEAGRWSAQTLPNKTPTAYRWVTKDGRQAIQADSRQSASLWRLRLGEPISAPARVRFSWWVEDLIPQANVSDVEREDAAARVVFGFDGDPSRLSARNRMLFELATALTGEAPPYATLMYVWDSELPVGTVVTNPRTDRIRKIVIDSGPQQLRRWRDHDRDLAADFRLAFGEEPGALLSVAVMSDSDNTRSQVRAWYGPPVLSPRAEPSAR